MLAMVIYYIMAVFMIPLILAIAAMGLLMF